jgi:hypothetical protein
MTPRLTAYLCFSTLAVVLALASACQPPRPPAPIRAAPANLIKSAPPSATSCSRSDPACGRTGTAYRDEGGEERWSCEIPCGAARTCPSSMACFDWDDGPENVCLPYSASGLTLSRPTHAQREHAEIALYHALGDLPEPSWLTHRFC